MPELRKKHQLDEWYNSATWKTTAYLGEEEEDSGAPWCTMEDDDGVYTSDDDDSRCTPIRMTTTGVYTSDDDNERCTPARTASRVAHWRGVHHQS